MKTATLTDLDRRIDSFAELERQSRAEGDESLAEVWRKRKEKAEAMREKSERGKE